MTASSSPSSSSTVSSKWVRHGQIPILILASLFLFALFTWPLPQYFKEGMISSHRPEVGAPRYVIHGDHLQLMYHFELMKGFITGETPWFHNLYEFNLGDDAATFAPDMYYAPFAWVYALGSIAGYPALGWNLASLFSVAFTLWGTWLLVRRFPAPLPMQMAATVCGVALPYRWVTLLHGSPTGFAMVYVPWILYGLHVSIRDRRMRGGWIAGLCLLMSAWGDIHTFFFVGLLTPFWCLFAFFQQENPKLNPREIRSLCAALSGFIVLGLLVVFQAVYIRAHLSDGSMAGGRTIQEVVLFSPEAGGLWSTDPDHRHNLIYLTYSAVFLVLLSLGMAGFRWRTKDRPAETRVLVLHLLLFAAIATIIFLSLGPRLSLRFGPRYWGWLTRLIPPYAMIRQTTKIFSILPAILAVFVVLPFVGWTPKRSKRLAALALLPLVGMLWESSARMNPTISLVDEGSSAYAAVRENAEARGEAPRALAVVLWPGDSHWASLYQYYAMRDRIRMVNGYRPHVPAGYYENVFRRYLELNQGFASEEILDDLLSRGIRHLILHEDAFPEQVSPFGVSQTLARFLAHPRIRLMTRDHAIWSFEIMEEASPAHQIDTEWEHAAPTRLWHLIHHGKPEEVRVIHDPSAFREHLARLAPGDPPLLLSPYETKHREDLRITLRMRGRGQAQLSFRYGEGDPIPVSGRVESDAWAWVEFPFPAFSGFEHDIEAELRSLEGELDVDLATMLDGPSTLDLAVGERIVIQAPVMFHAGYTDLADNAVVLEPDRAPHGEVVYGPRLILPEGRYQVHFRYRAEGGHGEIGSLRLREPDPGQLDAMPVPGNETTVEFTFTQREALPVVFAFTYFRTDIVRVHALEFTRIE